MPRGNCIGRLIPRWKEEEIKIMMPMVGYYPAQTITHKINKWNKENNTGAVRTVRATILKLNRLGYSEKGKIKRKVGITQKWSEAEIEYLIENNSSYPVRVLTQKINRWHRMNATGIKRTLESVRGKLQKMGRSQVPIDNNMTAAEWARQFGFHRHRVVNWTRLYGLRSTSVARNKLSISVEDMTLFAKKRPYLFSSANKEYLLYYFGESLTETILSHKDKCPDTLSKKRPILRVDTGEIYKSILEASKRLGIGKTAVRSEAKRGGWLRFV